MTPDIIKVCGMRDRANIAAVEALGVDFIGLIFARRSLRFVNSPLPFPSAATSRVGVFVDSSEDFILEMVGEYGLRKVQLHGSESAARCKALSARLPDGVALIKAFSIGGDTPLPDTTAYEGICEYFIFDTACACHGGSGRQFDWSVLSGYRGATPFLLSGGIGPDSLERLAEFRHPLWAGVDLNSRFESAPALKDVSLLSDFIKRYRKLFKNNNYEPHKPTVQ